MRSRLVALFGLLAIVAGLGVPAAHPSPVAAAAPAAAALPAAWPFDRLEIGFADAPGGAAGLRADAPFGLRYQYLAGGVNTGNGWATWNTDGDFVKWYVQDSVAQRDGRGLPVLPDAPEHARERAPARPRRTSTTSKNTGTMAAYWADVRLFMQKAEAGASGHPVVLHVEPDLWGYIEQAAIGQRREERAGRRGLERRRRPRGPAQHRRRLREGLHPPARPVRAARARRLPPLGVGDDVRPPREPDERRRDRHARGQGGELLRVARAPASTSPSPTSPIATRASTSTSTAMAARPGGTRRTSRGTGGSSAGSRRRRASAWSCGRSRWATRRCGRPTTPGATTRTTGPSGSWTTSPTATSPRGATTA